MWLLDYVHKDVWDSTNVTSMDGSRHFVIFFNDYYRYDWIYFLQPKNKLLEFFKYSKEMVENITSKKLKMIRSDNGTKYIEGAFKELHNQKSMVRDWIVTYAPQQNGVVE